MYTHRTDWNPKFNRVEIRDNGHKVLEFWYRVLDWTTCMTAEPEDFTIEVIIEGNHGQHYFADWICDGKLRSHGMREIIPRLTYQDMVYTCTINNDHASVDIRLVHDMKTNRLRIDHTNKRIAISRPQWGRTWRRPRLAA